METNGEGGGGGEVERRGRTELGGLLEAIGSSEVLEKRTRLVKQLEEFSADDLGLILQVLLASWIDSTCSGVAHCTLHRSILQVALKCSDLDITDYLGQFFALGAKASSWCEKHFQWSVKSTHQSQVVQEEEHNRLRLELLGLLPPFRNISLYREVTSLSFIISAKLFDVAAKCITELGFEVAEEQRVLNKADDPAPAHLAVGIRRPPPQEASRRCMHCALEKTGRWRRGPDGPGTLCNSCGVQFWKGRLLYSNSKKRRSSSKENSTAGDDAAALVDALPCGVGASLYPFFGHTFPSVSWEEAGPARAEEDDEELEWLSNKDAFPSVETMAVEVEDSPALDADAPPARAKRQRLVTANAVQLRQRCTHCGTEETPQWREGPEGARTLCNACGIVFKKKGGLVPEYHPMMSPAFSPHLHSNRHLRALHMHRQNSLTSSSSPQRCVLQEGEETSAASRATVRPAAASLATGPWKWSCTRSRSAHRRAARAPAPAPASPCCCVPDPSTARAGRSLLPSAPPPRPDAPSALPCAEPSWVTDARARASAARLAVMDN